MDREDALTVNTTAPPTVSLPDIMAAMKKEMTAMMAAMVASNKMAVEPKAEQAAEKERDAASVTTKICRSVRTAKRKPCISPRIVSASQQTPIR